MRGIEAVETDSAVRCAERISLRDTLTARCGRRSPGAGRAGSRIASPYSGAPLVAVGDTDPVPNNDVHPDLQRFARFAPRRLVGPRTLPLMRVALAWRGRLGKPVRDVQVITLGSGVGVRLFRPAGAAETTPALLWIHGGGYVLGTAQQDDQLCSRFSRRLGITVASVDYRLAPEHPYPVPLEDCYTALTWLAGLPSVDRYRIAIGGGQR
ncbi:esterase, partial [Mycobacterium avium 10-5560]